MIHTLARITALFASILVGGASAQSFPVKPIRMIVPFTSGGTNEQLARIVAQKFQEKWTQPVVVENKPGAGGNIGADFVAKSAPDGYTLLLATNTLTMNRFLFAQMPFDVERDFAPLAVIAATPFLVVVNNSLPVNSVAELIAYARAHPGKLSFGSPGIGTPHHLGAELFKTMTGTNLVHVPYKGSVPALTDVMTGQLQLMWITLNVGMPFVTSGKVRALALAERQRAASLRDLPVVAETVPNYEVSAWYAVLAPAGTPSDIVTQLSDELQRIFRAPELQEKLLPLGFQFPIGGPRELRATIASDLGKWGSVVKAAGIKPE